MLTAVLQIKSLFKCFSGARPAHSVPGSPLWAAGSTAQVLFLHADCTQWLPTFPFQWNCIYFKLSEVLRKANYCSQAILCAEIPYPSCCSFVCKHVSGDTREQSLQLSSVGTWHLRIPWKEKIKYLCFFVRPENAAAGGLQSRFRDSDAACFLFISLQMWFSLMVQFDKIIQFKHFCLQSIHLKWRIISIWAQ